MSNNYSGERLDAIKNDVQKKLFKEGLTELLTIGSRIKMPDPLAEGMLKLDRAKDRACRSTAFQLIYIGEPESGLIENQIYLLQAAGDFNAKAYTQGEMFHGCAADKKTLVAVIPIVFYRSSRV